MGNIAPPLNQSGIPSSGGEQNIQSDEPRHLQKIVRQITEDNRLGMAKNQTRRQTTDRVIVEAGNNDTLWTQRIIDKAVLDSENVPYTPIERNEAPTGPIEPVVPPSAYVGPRHFNPEPWVPYPGRQWVGAGGWSSLGELQAAYPYYHWYPQPWYAGWYIASRV